MPRKDGTGPIGAGAKTGKGMGFCNSSKVEKSDFGRGICNRYNDINTPENQKDLLMEQKAFFEERLNLINNKLNELDENK